MLQANNVRGVVIAEKTATSEQYFSSLQKFTVLEIGLVLMPITSQEEAADLLAQMVGKHFFTVKVFWIVNVAKDVFLMFQMLQ